LQRIAASLALIDSTLALRQFSYRIETLRNCVG